LLIRRLFSLLTFWLLLAAVVAAGPHLAALPLVAVVLVVIVSFPHLICPQM
jgi:hypothetical protein